MQLSGFWTTGGSTGHQQPSYTQAHWSQAGRVFVACGYHEGIAPDYLDSLAPSGVSGDPLHVHIDPGVAIVDGKWHENTARVTFAPTPPASGTRYDRVFLRADWSNFQVTLVYVTGGASPPTPENTPGSLYDLMVAQCGVTYDAQVTVTDERDWAMPAVDGVTMGGIDGRLQIADGGVIAGKVAAGGVSANAQLADDIVDDRVVGDRVPQFYRRQGGSGTNWRTPGTTSYTPGKMRIQAGSVQYSGSATEGEVEVTFPVAFSQVPLIFVHSEGTGILTGIGGLTGPLTSKFILQWKTDDGSISNDPIFQWVAYGPE